jgi:DNA-binding PadR family transcriptional regulator
MNRSELFRKEYFLLTCLKNGELQGRELRKAYTWETEKRMGYGTLYLTMSRLVEQGYANKRDVPENIDGEICRLRHFSLTEKGRSEIELLPPLSIWSRLWGRVFGERVMPQGEYSLPKSGAIGGFQVGGTNEDGEQVWQANQAAPERQDFPHPPMWVYRINYHLLAPGTEFYDKNQDATYIKISETYARENHEGGRKDLLGINPDMPYIVRITKETYNELSHLVRAMARCEDSRPD